MGRTSQGLPPRYDPLDPEILENPYPVYARLREAGPVCRCGPGQWAVTRHVDVAKLLVDDRLSSEYPAAYRAFSVGSGSTSSFYERIVLYRDPPDHGHLRALLRRCLAPERLSPLIHRLPQWVDELLRPALDGARYDVLNELAIPLSLRVMCGLIGFPSSEAHEIHARALDLSRAFGTRISDEDRAEADGAVDWFRDFVGGLLEERRKKPRDDVLSQMARAETRSFGTREDLVDNVAFLLFAGFETTGNLIGNGIAALAVHPGEFQRLRERPELAEPATEELLRYDPPIQGVARVAREPVGIEPRRIRAGRVLVLLLGSANRDASVFREPDRLDLGRSPNPHVSFGAGLHHCLGAWLARKEVHATLSRLSARVVSLELIETPVRRMETRFRCFASLPVALRPA